ncbi:mechanosensitive ion channel domain-containing protein [Lacihabitans lacunae]|uniref:Mechanosensitive ion channel domain-containing protein n=1 Tax=Lacihabitans lacunae TaxID=1028214 RepID=A0ABV7Z3C4_9BACT
MLPSPFAVLAFLWVFLVSATLSYFVFTLIRFILRKTSGHKDHFFFKTSHFFKYLLSAGAFMYVLYFIANIFDFEKINKIHEAYFLVYFITGSLYFTSLGDLLSGAVILIFRPYKRGDFVLIGNQAYPAIIEQVQFKSTRLVEDQNVSVSVRNSKVLSNVIINISKSRSNIFVHTQFVIESQGNMQALIELIRSEVEIMPKIRERPKIKIDGHTYLTDFSLIDTWVWCNSEDFQEVQQFMEYNLKQIFKLKNIKVL